MHRAADLRARRPGGHVRYPVAVNVPQSRDRGAELVVGRDRRAAGRGAGYLHGALYGAAAVHKQDIHRAGASAQGRARRDVGRPVAVQIPYSGDRPPKGIRVGKRGAVGSRAAYLGGPLYGAVAVHEQDVESSAAGPAGIVARSACRKIRHPVAVKIPDSGDRGAEHVVVCKRGAVGRGVAYLGGQLYPAVPVEQHDVERAASLPAGVVARGACRNVRHPVAVKIPDAGDRPPEPVKVCKQRAVGGAAVYLDGAPRRAVRVHQHDMHRAAADAARVVLGRACRDVWYPVAVDIPDAGHRGAEPVAGGKDRIAVLRPAYLDRALGRAVGPQAYAVHRARVGPGSVGSVRAGRKIRGAPVRPPDGQGEPELVVVGKRGAVWGDVVYLGGPLYGAVAVHQHHVDGAAAGPARIVLGRAGGQIRYPVAVNIPDVQHGAPKVVSVGKRRAVGSRAVYLDGALYGAVAVHEHYMNRAAVGAALVVEGGAGRDVRYPVAVQVPDAGNGYAKQVKAAKRRAVGRRAVYLGGALYCAVAVHEHDVDLAAPRRAGGQVRYPVAVQVPYTRDRRPKEGIVGKRGAVGRRAVYLGGLFYGAVAVHKQDMHGAAVGAALVVLGRAGGQVRHPVAVQVPHVRDRRAELVAVGKRGAVGRPAAYLRDALCGAVRVHEHHLQRPARAALARGVVDAPHEVGHAVAVKVAHYSQRLPKLRVVAKRQHGPEAAGQLCGVRRIRAVVGVRLGAPERDEQVVLAGRVDAHRKLERARLCFCKHEPVPLARPVPRRAVQSLERDVGTRPPHRRAAAPLHGKVGRAARRLKVDGPEPAHLRVRLGVEHPNLRLGARLCRAERGGCEQHHECPAQVRHVIQSLRRRPRAPVPGGPRSCPPPSLIYTSGPAYTRAGPADPPPPPKTACVVFRAASDLRAPAPGAIIKVVSLGAFSAPYRNVR